MNIEDYIRDALLSIIRGVRAAQQDQNVGAMVGRQAYGSQSSILQDQQGNMVSLVSFDLATTVDEKQVDHGGLKADIKILSAKAGTEATAQTSNVSRINFTVPLGIPIPASQKAEIDAANVAFDEQIANMNRGSSYF